ncbi:MAG TPA: hypothetical protein VM580_27415 [Labilithrix sp.]|jgi:hypothetical protein|nr:hypothetical protein [Labilithrix sp.]
MTRLHTIIAITAIGGAGAYAACSKTTPEPVKAEPPVTSSAAAPAMSSPHAPHPVPLSPPPAGPDDLGWEAPNAWQSVPNPSPMRKATYKIAKVAGDAEDAELSVMVASGGVDANVKRWAGQFGNAEPKTEVRNPNGLAVTVVEIKGTYASGGMMGGPATPKPNFMLLGAVVDAGERQHFFKMTGPEKTVSAAKKDFDALVSSFRAK